MSFIDQGWAIRRVGSCLAGIETNCGGTATGFVGCCPNGYECPKQYNIACCAPNTNCTQALTNAPKPRCANATWDLFDNGGDFCCERGQTAFNRGGTDICGGPGFTSQDGDVQLSLISSGVSATQSSPSSSSASATSSVSLTFTSSSSSSSSTTSRMASQSLVPTSSGGSSTHGGAIIGGVIGGIAFLSILAALLVFLVRRRKQKKHLVEAPSEYQPGNDLSSIKYSMAAGQPIHEADYGQDVPYAQEMSAQVAYELPSEYNNRKQ